MKITKKFTDLFRLTNQSNRNVKKAYVLEMS